MILNYWYSYQPPVTASPSLPYPHLYTSQDRNATYVLSKGLHSSSDLIRYQPLSVGF